MTTEEFNKQLRALFKEILDILPLAASLAASDDLAYRTMALSGLLDNTNPNNTKQPAADTLVLGFFWIAVAVMSLTFSTNLNATPIAVKLNKIKLNANSSAEDIRTWQEYEEQIFRIFRSSLAVSIPPAAIVSLIMFSAKFFLHNLGNVDEESAQLAQNFTRPFSLVAIPAMFLCINIVELIYVFQKTKALNISTINWMVHLLLAWAVSLPENGLSDNKRLTGVISILTSQIVTTTGIFWHDLRHDPRTQNMLSIPRLITGSNTGNTNGNTTLRSDVWNFIESGAAVTGAVVPEMIMEVVMTSLVSKLSLLDRNTYTNLAQSFAFGLPFAVHTSLASMFKLMGAMGTNPTQARIQSACIAGVSSTLLVNSILPLITTVKPSFIPSLIHNNAPEVQQQVDNLQYIYSLALVFNSIAFVSMYALRALDELRENTNLSWRLNSNYNIRWASTIARAGSLGLGMVLMLFSEQDLRSLSYCYLIGMASSCFSMLYLLYKSVFTTPTVRRSMFPPEIGRELDVVPTQPPMPTRRSHDLFAASR